MIIALIAKGVKEMSLLMSFILGVIIGSFLNVCIYRIPKGESVARGRSHCTNCGKTLGATELIPVISYLFLRGKCKSCKVRISPRYALVELLCGCVFTLAYAAFGVSARGIITALFYAVLIVVSFIDLDTMEIPNGAHIIIIALSVASVLLVPEISIIDRLIGLVCVSVPFLLISLFTGGFGGGDIKLLAVSGLLLGWKGVLTGALIAIVVGACVGVAYKLITHKRKMPFGPFLSLGLAAGAIIGEPLITWYIGLIIR